jgi:flavodoxin
MKKIITCQSVHKGCTAKIAEAISEILETEAFKPEEASK